MALQTSNLNAFLTPLILIKSSLIGFVHNFFTHSKTLSAEPADIDISTAFLSPEDIGMGGIADYIGEKISIPETIAGVKVNSDGFVFLNICVSLFRSCFILLTLLFVLSEIQYADHTYDNDNADNQDDP